MKLYLHGIHLYNYVRTLYHHKEIHKKFLDNKTYNWPLVKAVVNPRQWFGCVCFLRFWNAPVQNNQGMKVQVKITFKNFYYFLSREKAKTKKRDRPCLNFFWTLSSTVHQVPYFKINIPLFCCPLFFNLHVTFVYLRYLRFLIKFSRKLAYPKFMGFI